MLSQHTPWKRYSCWKPIQQHTFILIRLASHQFSSLPYQMMKDKKLKVKWVSAGKRELSGKAHFCKTFLLALLTANDDPIPQTNSTAGKSGITVNQAFCAWLLKTRSTLKQATWSTITNRFYIYCHQLRQIQPQTQTFEAMLKKIIVVPDHSLSQAHYSVSLGSLETQNHNVLIWRMVCFVNISCEIRHHLQLLRILFINRELFWCL